MLPSPRQQQGTPATALGELKNACQYLGFGLEQTAPNGLEKNILETRLENPGHWSAAVKVISAALARHQPRVIFFPHEFDWKQHAHGTHFLVVDALKSLPANFQCASLRRNFGDKWHRRT